MARFREVLEGGGLFDLGWRGDKFTWNNKHEDETFTKERLDRAVMNSAWKEIFKEGWVEILVDRSSDYKLIMLTLNQPASQEWKVKRMFTYEAKWALEEECKEVIKRVWLRGQADDESAQSMNCLLENVKEALLRWSKKLGGDKGKSIREKTEKLLLL
ncbi:uncharacterized protein LOC121239501 [Juglans microcarpa x Juglans regia]|uniref:uncharacterized protein LOC121239501 n=1 Tax=Juglans microcarpa x Juglans regia TaxID=2249226 RepID=UPI001B7F7599|nr:uncharacterized protein LOC121239501 [Juglans microcarpa x Juglans regia]